MRHFFVWAALLMGLTVALVGVPGQAADSEHIDKLVKQLGSGRFNEREKAQKALEEIGLPAYEALKKAAQTGDPETKRRAADLVSKLEKQVVGKKVLAPTKVKLSYKETPVKDALADLSKKIGFPITLVDPENKLKDRKVTLELAETTFWEAFDQFCAKAGLVEGEANEGGIQPAFDQPDVIQIQPGVIIRPRIQIQQAPAPQKDVPAQPKPAEKALPEKLKKAGALDVQVEEKAVPAQKPQKAQVGKPIAAAQQPALQPAQIRRRPFRPQPFPQPQSPINQLIVKSGTPKTEPTSYSGAVRVKTTDNVAQFGPVDAKQLLVGLKVSPEPKLRWQNLVNVRIDKAIDDQDQNLMPVMGGGPAQQPGQITQVFPGGGQVIIIRGGGRVQIGNGWGGGVAIPAAGGHHFVPVRLTKGEKPSKSLKELSGSIAAQVLGEAEVHLSAADILKATGKTFKGKDGGSLKILGVEENNGVLTLKLDFDAPKDVVPALPTAALPVGGPVNGPGGGIQILPAVPGAAPALPQANALQVQIKAAQVQVQQVQVQQIQIIGGGFGFGGNGVQGLELIDEKGNVIPCVGSEPQGGIGGAAQSIHHMSFRLQQGQKPAKLVFKGSKSISVEIPFTLKDVKLP